jgi:hypothetical protein
MPAASAARVAAAPVGKGGRTHGGTKSSLFHFYDNQLSRFVGGSGLQVHLVNGGAVAETLGTPLARLSCHLK